ncbi:predicted protein [Postia placenta Mad-698-R]|uniref:Uncharacterized protein n=1 Tax=Postia placenta MAD-698-R-SB12 TaxID=670580 RepID=A0A1X6NH60_9APHY|nr:hypothetical protein POSPLADRAFT_1127608 [Postia placenta MAD-698-R-SB12]EED81511.1 predicted protein [Postia placenta Mad-698-R]OSX67862.1 hypothetical protein POSPLADRAFT_1127608 [Postia placenta MAD-698-R-SB12]
MSSIPTTHLSPWLSSLRSVVDDSDSDLDSPPASDLGSDIFDDHSGLLSLQTSTDFGIWPNSTVEDSDALWRFVPTGLRKIITVRTAKTARCFAVAHTHGLGCALGEKHLDKTGRETPAVLVTSFHVHISAHTVNFHIHNHA